MDITCTACGAVKHFKPSAAAEVNRTTYRCRPCFLAASGTRTVKCRRCGKERTYDKSVFRRVAADLCRDCYNAERRERFVTVTCPQCGRVRELPPSRLADGSEGYCRNCPGVYDTTIPDTYDAGYVAGAILGDGFLFKSKVGNSFAYGLRLEVTSEAFAAEFAGRLAACTGNSVWRGEKVAKRYEGSVPGMPAGEYTLNIVFVTCREWYEKLSPLKHGRRFDLIRDKGPEFRRGFVQGMIDAEGYINPKYTDVANKDLELLALVRDFLISMGHKACVYGPYPYARGVAHLRVNKPLRKTA